MTAAEQLKTEENEQLRKFLTYYANMSSQKKVVVFFLKRIKSDADPSKELLQPVQVTLGADRTLDLESDYEPSKTIFANKGFVLYSKHITNNICENILQEAADSKRKIEVFFAVQELKKNVRKEDEILNITTFPYFDDIPSSMLNPQLLTNDYILNNFPFPVQFVSETSPGNYQLYWSLKYPQKVNNLNYWKQILSVMKIVGDNIFGGSDSGGSNINQIYRLPGTYNFKQKYSTPPKTKLLCFDKTKALEFREVWTWILNKYVEIKYSVFFNKYNSVLKDIAKNNDYLLLENITGDFEHHESKAKSPSERSMSVIKRIQEKYNLADDELYNFWKESPNEEKSKGHLTKNTKQYFDRMLSKVTPKEKKIKPIKPANKLASSNREPGIIQASEVPKIFTGRKMKEVFKDGRRTITRLSHGGMSEKKGQLLLWLMAQAVKNNFVFEMPTSDFFKKFNLTDKTFWDFQKSVKFFAINDTKYESFKNFESETLSIIGLIKRKEGFVKIRLTEDFKLVYHKEKGMRKLLDSEVINSLDVLKERYSFNLLLQLNFILYDQKYNGKITLQELANRLGIDIKNADASKWKFAERVRKALDEIKKSKLFNFSYIYDNRYEEFAFKKHNALTYKNEAK